MDAHTHEEIKLYGSFTITLTISREPKDPIDLEHLLEAALIDQMPKEWLVYLQEEYTCNDIQETASVIISWDTIKSTPLPNEPLIYEVVLPKDEWMIEAAAKAHEELMDNYYRIKEDLEKQEAARWRGLQSQVENWSGITVGDTVRIRGGAFGIAKKEGWYDAEDDRHAIPYWTVRLFQGNTIDVKTKHLTKVNLTKEINK